MTVTIALDWGLAKGPFINDVMMMWLQPAHFWIKCVKASSECDNPLWKFNLSYRLVCVLSKLKGRNDFHRNYLNFFIDPKRGYFLLLSDVFYWHPLNCTNGRKNFICRSNWNSAVLHVTFAILWTEIVAHYKYVIFFIRNCDFNLRNPSLIIN